MPRDRKEARIERGSTRKYFPGDGTVLHLDCGSYTNLYMRLKFIEHTYTKK